MRLREYSTVEFFERAAALNPELRSLAGAVRSDQLSRLCQSLFGRQTPDLLPEPPENYSWQEDGIYYNLEEEETSEDLAAFTAYEAGVDLYYRVYVGLARRSDADLVKLFAQFGCDVSDDEGRMLNCVPPMAEILLASLRGDFAVPAVGKPQVDAATWGESLAREAARFRGSGRP